MGFSSSGKQGDKVYIYSLVALFRWDPRELHAPFLGAGKSCCIPSFGHSQGILGFVLDRPGFAFNRSSAGTFFSFFT